MGLHIRATNGDFNIYTTSICTWRRKKEEEFLVAREAVYLSRQIPTFRMKMLPQSSEQRNDGGSKLYLSTKLHNFTNMNRVINLSLSGPEISQ
jgi:hypothetical protein